MISTSRLVLGVLLLGAWIPAQTWVSVSAATVGPTPRAGATAAHDPATGYTYVIGGGAGATVYGDAWAFDGVGWQAMPNLPSTGTSTRCVFDVGRGVLVLVTITISPAGSEVLELWESNGLTWTRRNLPTMPPPRAAFGLVYLDSIGAVMLCGGSRSGAPPFDMRDVWFYDGVVFTQAASVNAPYNTGMGAAYDSGRQKVVAVVGSPNNRVSTVEYDPWTGVWNGVRTERVPGVDSFSLTYDSLHGVVVAPSSFDTFGRPIAGAWTFNGTDWTRVPTSGARPPTGFAATTFDSTRGVVFTYGGRLTGVNEPEQVTDAIFMLDLEDRPGVFLTGTSTAGRVLCAGLRPGGVYRCLVSTTPSRPLGTGPWLGLEPSTFLAAQIALPQGAGPFHFQATATSQSFGPYAVPRGTYEAVIFETVGGGRRASPISRLVVQ